jgi:carbonic anhydrase
MKGVLHPENVEELPAVKSWLHNGELALRVVKENCPDLRSDALLHALTEENVVAQLDHLRTHPSVGARVARGKLTLHGWVYHIATGQVDAYDAQRGRFVPIENYSFMSAAPRPRLALIR